MNKTIQDKMFGTLIYDAEFGCFRGRVNFGNKPVEIWIYFTSQPDQVSEDDLKKAQEAYFTLVARKATIEAEIVREFLPLYNEIWRDGDVITQEQFLAVLELETIDIKRGLPTDLWYVAGDLFTDHSINVRFKEDGDILEIDLAG